MCLFTGACIGWPVKQVEGYIIYFKFECGCGVTFYDMMCHMKYCCVYRYMAEKLRRLKTKTAISLNYLINRFNGTIANYVEASRSSIIIVAKKNDIL